ncbi:MAG: PEGA domain-containing protein [Syntrophothermus sp.]
MKKIYLLLSVVLAFILASCDATTDPSPATTTGSIFVQSDPSGAIIKVDGISTGKTTPDSVVNISTGNHDITLSLEGYADTTITVNVREGMLTSPAPVTLRSTLTVTKFGPVRIYESYGTSASQPSGLILSTGEAVSSSNTSATIYYHSTAGGTYEITGAPGKTVKFNVGPSNSLEDGQDSPLATSSWTSTMPDRPDKYYFIYDNDLHYTKFKVVNFGGGTIGAPAWVEVEYYYNTTVNDRRF